MGIDKLQIQGYILNSNRCRFSKEELYEKEQ